MKKRKVGKKNMVMRFWLFGRGSTVCERFLWRLNEKNNFLVYPQSGNFLPQSETNESDSFSLFFLQNFQEANAYCYWNSSLLDAVTSLTFIVHVTPSTILVTGDESCLETVRSAWARKVLRAPSAYSISLVGNVHTFFYTL